MPHTTLVTVEDVSGHLSDPDWVLIDCRFSLGDTRLGRRSYLEAHIPGAVYAHLEEHLSGRIVPGRTGRHPLPEIASFVQTLSDWGITSGVQVVAYDDVSGAMAARLWWMLNWLGHEAAALLDGGWLEWQRSGLPMRCGPESRKRMQFTPHEVLGANVDAEHVESIRTDPSFVLLDARSGQRFRGEAEPIDSAAGHIPGAVSAPFEGNLGSDGRFLASAALRSRYGSLLGDTPAENTICYCGSGVTAAHNLLALAHAGMGKGRLYAGSWSEWITDPKRPIARD